MASPAVEVRQLCKRYGDRLVVDHVDLQVHQGEIVGLLGANGAGKTTTVECVSGQRRPDSGVVRVLGFDPQVGLPQLRPLVGGLLQQAAVPARLRMGEVIQLFQGPRSRPVDGLLRALGLAEHLERPFSALTAGHRQRLCLVQALLQQPRVVILDEVTRGLDPAARRAAGDAIRSLREAGTSLLLVTHHPHEAQALCDRVVVMDRGRVLDSGPPAELVERHAPWAVVCFGNGGRRIGGGLRTLDGVRDVRRVGTSVELHGHRRMIANVCSYLLGHGHMPDDLAVTLPNLEEVVVALLAQDPDRAPHPIGESP